MFESVPSFFRTNLSLFVLTGTIVVSVLYSYWLYRRTIPPLSNTWKVSLGILRGLAVALIFLLFFSPQLTLVWQQKVSNKIALVIDRSASMGLVERNESRLVRANRIAQELYDHLQERTPVSVYGFNTDTVRLENLQNDTARFATDINKALTRIVDKEKDLKALVLLSDGNFTTGQNPLYSGALLRANIFTIGIGDTVEIPDLLIADVQANKIVYQDKISPIQINLMARGFSGKETLLQVKGQDRVLHAQKVKIGTAGGILPVLIDLKPEQVGLQHYEISVGQLPREALLDNNKYSLILDVLKSKIKVGILAAQPGFEIKFLYLLLAFHPDLQVKLAIPDQEVKGSVSSLSQVLDSIDVLILNDYPTRTTGQENLKLLEQHLTTNPVPSLLVLGTHPVQVNWEFMSRFYSVRSRSILNPVLRTQVVLTDPGKNLPLLNIFNTETENLNFWQQCPPIAYPFEKVEMGENARVVMQTMVVTGTEKVRAPVMLIKQAGGRKNLYLLGSGFWRWHFMLAEDKQFKDGWKTIVYNLVRWLSTPGSGNNVLISTEKKSYQIGESVQVKTEVYDGAYNQVDDGLVRIKISGPGGVFEVDGTLLSGGLYTAEFQVLAEGEYTLDAEAWRNDVSLGKSSMRLVCTPVNVEFISTRQDYNLLQKVAEKSGGVYVNESNYRDLMKVLDFPVRYEEVIRTFELWQKLAVLLLIILLFTVEWFIRKRKGLA